MIIGFDAKRAVQNFTGLGNYGRYLIETLLKYAPEHKYILYAPKDSDNKRLTTIKASNSAEFAFPKSTLNKKFKSIWRIHNIYNDINSDNIDIFHGLSNELPLTIKRCTKVKSIVTVHDLIFRRLPNCYKPIDRGIYDYKFRKACKNADVVVAVSECTKRDIVNDYNIDPSKIEVIYQGCDPSFTTQCSEEKLTDVKKKYNLPENFILSVGSIEERKNALVIVKALMHLPKEIKLVLVGKHTEYCNAIKSFMVQNKLTDRVIFLHGVDFTDLPAVYQCASVFCYMSLYEGFGIPLLEALWSRVPVIGATGSCLEEAGGKASLYVTPNDYQELAKSIESTFDKQTRNSMVTAGLEHAKQFNQENFAKQTINLYNKLLQG